MTKNKQLGFATLEIIIIVVVLAAITGLAIWRITSSRQNANQKNFVSGPLTQEDRQRLEDSGEITTTEASPQNTSTNNNQSTSTSPTSNQASPTSASNSSSSNQSTSQNTSQTNQQSSANQSSPPAAPSTPVASNRPTAEFCAQKNGGNFSVWAADNSNHTYQVWENGGWVNKTETGTAGRNFDTMQVVGVIPYAKKAEWANCSEKAGYVMFYYKPSGSAYTYNWLVPFEHASLVQL